MTDNKIQDIDDKTSGSRSRRLKILGHDEIKTLYGLPHFSDEEREQYFALTSSEKATFDELHSIKSKIFFDPYEFSCIVATFVATLKYVRMG